VVCRGGIPSVTQTRSLLTAATELLASPQQRLPLTSAVSKATMHSSARTTRLPLSGTPRAISCCWQRRRLRNLRILLTCSPTGLPFMRYRCLSFFPNLAVLLLILSAHSAKSIRVAEWLKCIKQATFVYLSENLSLGQRLHMKR
jgi:hypothetical protein